MPSKRVRIFAGPNGSGKSSLFHDFEKRYPTGYFINADLLEKQLAGGTVDLSGLNLEATQEQLEQFKQVPASKSLFEKAGHEGHQIDISVHNNKIVDGAQDSHSYEGSFVAAFIRHLSITQERSFSFETVMSHPSKIDEIRDLVENHGYRAYLYFVCIDDPSVNIARIKDRVAKGGHDVDDYRVEDRYFKTLKLLHKVLPFCYRAYLFDNSGKTMKLLAEQFERKLFLQADEYPNWFIKYVVPYYNQP